jgi:hypothetical protein
MPRVLRRLWRKRLKPWAASCYGAYTEWRFQRRYARQERQRQQEADRMEIDALQQAQAKALLAQLDATTIAALKAVLREEVLPTLREDALTLARQELEETLAKGRERLADELAAYKESVDAEVERRVEADVQRELAEAKVDYEDRLQELRGQRTQARQQRDLAEQQLLALLQQMLGEPRYLRNAHVQEFDLWAANQVLARLGWRLRSRATYSERVVKTKLDAARWAQRALFWIEHLPGEGVADEAEDESAPDDQGQQTPDRLARPDAGEGG